MKIALYTRKIDDQLEPYLCRLKELLVSNGIEVVMVTGDPLSGAIDFVFSIGGDGTLLSAVHLIGDMRIPVIGINFGHLGFLTTAGKEDIDGLVEDLMAGHYTIEERTLLHTDFVVHSGDKPTSQIALNEVVLHRTESTSLLRTDLFVDDRFVSTYAGDGLIVATPTGSTAYSLSCGGPILTPDSGCFVITPIAAHSLTLRPIIVSDTSKITLISKQVGSRSMLSLDSATAFVEGGEPIQIERAGYKIPLVRLNKHNFFTALHEKLAL